MRQIIFLLITIVSLTSCRDSSNKVRKNDVLVDKYILPPDATPIVYSGYIHISTDVDGVQGNFLLDAGAYNIFLDSIFYKSNNFGYDNTFEDEISGIGNGLQPITVIQDKVNISFGNLQYETSSVPVLNLKSVGGDYVDGLIGIDFFFDAVLEINYIKQYYRTYATINQVYIFDYEILPLEIIDHFFCIPLTVKINSSTSITGKFIIDTGSPISTITSSVAKSNDLDKKIESKVYYYTEYGGIGGESSCFDFIADTVQISNFYLSNVNMSYSADSAGVLESGEYHGILGNNILERFDIVMDFNNNNLYIKPNETFSKPYIFDRTGFTHVDRCKTMGGWIVTGLTENSAVEKLGLRIDDIIISVNKIPVEEISYEIQNHYFDNLDKVSLVIKSPEGLKNIEYELAPLL